MVLTKPGLPRLLPRALAAIAAFALVGGSITFASADPVAVVLQRNTERSAQRGAQRDAGDDATTRPAKKDEELKLEKYFPERSPFGPTATGMTFSQDGRFAAFLFRPYAERRHGSDLYIYDTQTRKSRRVTSASRMAEFQADARRVVEDREKKARAARHPKVAEIEARSNGKAKEETAEKREEEAPPATQPAEQPDLIAPVLGNYGGRIETSSEVAKVEPGTSFRLSITREGDVVNGLLHAGLVRLPLRNFEIEGDTVTAAAGDGQDGIDGILEATFEAAGDSATLTGTVMLTEPPLEISFEARRESQPAAQEERPNRRQRNARRQAQEQQEPEEPVLYARGILEVEAQDLELGDLVTERDAEDNRAPRYGGIQSIEWAPEGHQMLIQSDGDVYLMELDPEQWASSDEQGRPYLGTLERLTNTRERESSVAFLPDGSGYTYLREGALIRVRFGEHAIVQLDPELGRGERMVGYRISPDGNKLVFLSQRDLRQPGQGQQQDDDERRQFRRGGGDDDEQSQNDSRRVTIISYRDRFATARQVPRQMPDEAHRPQQMSIYLYDLEGHAQEKGSPQRVFTRRTTGPRDVTYVPDWSPDSTKVAFAAFEQESSQVYVIEASFADRKDGSDGSLQDAGRERTARADAGDEPQQRGGPGRPATAPATQPDETFQVESGRVVYRFLHDGGPNTPRMIIPQYLADSRHMVFITELSGFRQLHVLDPVYERLEQLTRGMTEVYPFHISKDHKRLFATATVEGDPAQEWLYEVDLESREMRRLCKGEGVMDRVAVSDDGSHALGIKSDFGAPSEMVAFDCSGDTTEEYVLSSFHPKEAHEMVAVKPEYFSFENRHGHTIHGHMFKPADWSPEDKRPLLIYVYGGPLGERNMISRGDFSGPSYFFARYMAEKHGWVTATIDPRGASGLGALFEKANFGQVGKPQTEDLVDAADWLVDNAGVDPKRRALHGWSFGGFQTQMTMYTEPDAFAAGIAGAGPTEWQNYNSWYTTGTVGPAEDFREDLDQHSLLPLAKNLKGRLLLVHGMEDSNVLYQDTVRVYRELLRANKESLVDLFVDPTGGHGLGGDVKTLGRYRKYEDFLLTHVGKGQASGAPRQDSESDVTEAETARAEQRDAARGAADASN